MEDLQEEIQEAVYEKRQYIWEDGDRENLYEYFSDLLKFD